MAWIIRSEAPNDAEDIGAVLTNAFSLKDEAELVAATRNTRSFDSDLFLVCVEMGRSLVMCSFPRW
ncbi:MAG: hypothetical protein GX097_01595 [Methanomicrobiales archaeon]|nr:hypothetical protein [Methanomicrobiales archaeon]